MLVISDRYNTIVSVIVDVFDPGFNRLYLATNNLQLLFNLQHFAHFRRLSQYLTVVLFKFPFCSYPCGNINILVGNIL